MISNELTDLERGVMEKLLAGQHPILHALRDQFLACRVKKREMTGCGFFTELELDQSPPPVSNCSGSLRIGDVSARIPGLKHGAGFVLFVNDGYLDMLEGYSYDESWPEADITEFELVYIGGLRNLAALRLDSSST